MKQTKKQNKVWVDVSIHLLNMKAKFTHMADALCTAEKRCKENVQVRLQFMILKNKRILYCKPVVPVSDHVKITWQLFIKDQC